MMKVARIVITSLFSLWAGIAVFGQADVAQAQSACSCPAGTKSIGNNQCQSQTQTQTCPRHRGDTLVGKQCQTTGNLFDDDDLYQPTLVTQTFVTPATCRNVVPQVGAIVATQQQSSFGTIASVLRGRRDALGGGIPGGVRPLSPAVWGYAPADSDGSPGALGYAAPAAQNNPLYAIPVAPPPVIANGPTWATWVEGLGDWEKRNPLNSLDVGRTQSTYSTHAGLDATWANPFLGGDYVVAGLVGNYTSTRVDLTGLPASLRLEGPGGGFYAMYLNGGFSIDAAAKVDFVNLKEDFSGLIAEGFTLTTVGNTIDITNVGFAGNVQYKNKFSWGFIEPTMGFAFTHTMFGNNAAAMGLQDASTLKVQAGARFGGAFQVNGVSVEPNLGLLAYSNVIADGTTLAVLGAPTQDPPTDKGLVRAEVNPELNFGFDNGYSAYIRGSVRAGTELVGGSVKAGVRKEF
jgi:hypothetical protein